jgi:ribonucleoside-diphosphate reductase alpha chain
LAPRTTHLKPQNGSGGSGVVAVPPAASPRPTAAPQTATIPAAVAQRQTVVAPAKPAVDTKAEKIRIARQKGYEGDPCGECGQLTLVRSGACCKCDTCGATSGCS